MSKNNLAFKTSVVEGVKEKMQAAQSMVLIDYRGLTVAEVTDLRNRCRKEGVEYAVIKNTMIRKAARGTRDRGPGAHAAWPHGRGLRHDRRGGAGQDLGELH